MTYSSILSGLCYHSESIRSGYDIYYELPICDFLLHLLDPFNPHLLTSHHIWRLLCQTSLQFIPPHLIYSQSLTMWHILHLITPHFTLPRPYLTSPHYTTPHLTPTLPHQITPNLPVLDLTHRASSSHPHLTTPYPIPNLISPPPPPPHLITHLISCHLQVSWSSAQ